jgi:integrase/recombinase XerD
VTAGGRRLDEPAAFRMVRRLARAAGLDCADRLSPHSLRHAFVTLALDAGVSLRDVQDAAGHADPRTTRRYDRARHNLDRAATYAVAAHLAEDSRTDEGTGPLRDQPFV